MAKSRLTMTPPYHNLVLFDGVCNFCSHSVQFIIRHDKAGVFKFVPIQSEHGQQIYHSFELDPNDMQTFLLVKNGRPLLRSDAALEITKEFDGWWRFLRTFKLVPKGIRDWCYLFIARHRYRWFGRRDSCMIPSPEIRERFLA